MSQTKIVRSFLGNFPITRFNSVLSKDTLQQLWNIDKGPINADQLSSFYTPKKDPIFDKIESEFVFKEFEKQNYVLKNIMMRYLEQGTYIHYNNCPEEKKNQILHIPNDDFVTTIFEGSLKNESYRIEMGIGDMFLFSQSSCTMMTAIRDSSIFILEYEPETHLTSKKVIMEAENDPEENFEMVVAMPAINMKFFTPSNL